LDHLKGVAMNESEDPTESGAEGKAVTPAGLIHVPEQKVDAARALEVVQALLADEGGPERYNANPKDAFDDMRERLSPKFDKTWYEAIPPNSRAALEGLDPAVLKLLSDLDHTFVEDGLYVEVPSPGKLFYK
jgi:hypothetical protein